MGAIGGALVVALALGSTPEHGHEGDSASLLETFWELALESAPALLIAYLLAGLIGVFITPARAQWLSGGSRPSQALRGVTFGLPMPVCSCGVLPLYESLVRRGVPATAAMGFLIATPELGLDALLLSIPLLGSTLTLARLVAAFAVAIVVAVIVGRFAPEMRTHAHDEHHHEDERSVVERVREGLHFGLVELFDHTMPWVIAGLIIAALAEPLLAHAIFTEMPSWLQVPLFAVIGVPIYVCASGATPIAAIAIHKGISAGAALAFLLAGPATNVTTFGILSKLHGRRTALLFGLSVAICAIGAGWAVDWLMLEATGDVHAHAHHEHSMLQVCSLGALTVLFVVSLFRQGPRGVMHQITQPIH